MQPLANFSVETDDVILLHFQNGTRRRVGFKELDKYLDRSDLTKVMAALRLRRDFLRRNLPRTMLSVAVCIGLLAAGLVGENRLAARRQTPASELDRNTKVHQAVPLPSASPTIKPTVSASPVPLLTPVPTPVGIKPAVLGVQSQAVETATPAPRPQALLAPVVHLVESLPGAIDSILPH